ncbi:RagB/SusD family nutrient uptake outer membrane protein [Anaerorudis cellulosivorans]|uniref:RagB/SusD family nutrient uptake outer membrane protein n=1 Tax=Anaerorudis cellulosivorans TaxID=3397862 RepID=UPI002220434B|nr:RagB/SusD family nutrient uptake outer membrane protein [Seramator thermalis]MCW1734435.1 RagB/SusD family nutrient uptake outer membrane protein [Seramator thermalis]
MKKDKLKYCFSIILFIIISLPSCNDLDLAPTNKFTDLNYWTSESKASAVLSMAYNQMFGSGYFFANERLSDNLYEGRGNTDEKIITSGQADAALGRFANEWSSCYAGIKTCHTFLENVDRVPKMDETLKTRMKAEARFIRAFLFFRLASQYGDVPLFDHNLTVEEANSIVRSAKSDVINFVRNELNEIVSVLPTKQEYSASDNGRITKGAVIMLLARTYLYENDWANVATLCEKIMNGEYGKYELFPSYSGLFLPENEYNNEVILDMGYTLTYRTWSDFYDAIPLSVGGRINAFAPTQELVDDYIMKNGKGIKEEGSGYNEDDPYSNRDPRFAATIVYHGYKWKKGDGTVSTIYIKPGSSQAAGASNLDEYAGPGQNSTATGYYLRKYFDPTAPAGMEAGLNLILMRYADVLLMYAESKYELNQMSEDVWNKTIKPIRVRAGFTDASALNYPGLTDLENIIRRERRCELAIEGLRLFDIRRWKTIETVMNGYPHGAKFAANNTQYIQLDQRKFNKDRDYLFAIPQSQRDINKNLTQNPGY